MKSIVTWLLFGGIVTLWINAILADTAASAARDKGYGKGGWFILCLLFGIVAFIVVAALPDKTLQEEMREQNDLLRQILSYTNGESASVELLNKSTNTNDLAAESLNVPSARIQNGVRKLLFGHNPEGSTLDEKKIEWKVLERDENSCTMMATEGLVVKKYNDTNEDVSWEESSIRRWLNNEFLQTAFTEEERALILETKVKASANVKSKKWVCDTDDRAWLLSYEEVERFMKDSEERICVPSKVAEKKAYKNSDGATWWWLRSTGKYAKSAMSITSAGMLNDLGVSVTEKDGVVRPVIRIKI